jgi:PKD repeat protein
MPLSNFIGLDSLSGSSSKFSSLAILALLVAAFSGAAAASPGINSAEIVDRTDADGDGYVSSITVEIEADTTMNEQGNSVGNLLQRFGHPSFTLKFRDGKEIFPTATYTEVGKAQGTETVRFELTHDKIEQGKNFHAQGPTSDWQHDQIVKGEKEITRIRAYLEESDTPNKVDQYSDELVDTHDIITTNPLKFESEEEDQKKEVSIESNPADATIYIDGEKKGETDWSGQMMVDKKKRDGLVNVRLEKNGYKTINDRVDINPPDSLNYDLEKDKKPLVVDTQPRDADATVTVKGEEIGTAPLSQKFWVKEELDVTVEADGYETESYEDVKVPEQLPVSLQSTDASDDSTSDDTSSGNLDYGNLNYDQINDYNLNSLDYQRDLLNKIELPDMFYAKFNSSEDKFKAGNSVTFDASGTYHTYGNITGYKWDFGDGSTTGVKQSPTTSHEYDSPGDYTVNLTVLGSNDTERYSTNQVSVESVVPKPNFQITGKKTEGKPLTFDASNSADPDGNIASYNWDLGDGSTATGEEVSHSYSSAGQYTVKLEVTDNSGASETLTRTVEVARENLAPKPSFSASSTTLDVNQSVSFDASNSFDPDGSIKSYYWDFGDGISSKETQTSHKYRTPGTYKVNLTTVDDQRDISFKTKEIKVEGKTDETQQAAEEQIQDTQELEGAQGQAKEKQTKEPRNRLEESEDQENPESNQNKSRRDSSSESSNSEGSGNEGNTVEILVNLIRSIFG